MPSSTYARGIISTIAGVTLWGFTGALAQYVFENSTLHPLMLTTMRMLGAGLLFLAVFAAFQRNELRTLVRDRSAWRPLAIFGCIGLFGAQITYLVAISYTNGGTATVLSTVSIVCIMAATYAPARRWPSWAELIGALIAIVATVLIATKGDLSSLNMPLPGLLFGLASGVAVAIYVMSPRSVMARYSDFLVTGIGMMLGGLGATCLSFAAHALHVASGGRAGIALSIPTLSARVILAILVLTVLGTFLTFFLYLHGVALIGGVLVSLLGTLEPVSAVIFAALWLHTPFVWADWLGLALMVAMVFLVTLAPARHP